MTTLGSLVKGSYFVSPVFAPFDPGKALLEVTAAVGRANMTASGAAVYLGAPATILASIAAWANQDDDAHEPCSLTACRHPLHPGPCKGWKGTLHQVAPGTYKQIEEERVRKANERRVKRIADLKAQGKPIPRRLLAEIKPKPAPNTHAAQNASTVPLGQVNQKADLAGGQAHTAGQAVSKAAGVQVKTAPPLPLGPKQKKPTVAGRGPAFVITQPKVTDTYKLDKADKITPQEWDDLSDADKKAIRDELTAIKARGFGPQQTKADALLAKLPAPGGKAAASKAPAAAPGKVSLGQAAKAAPAAPKAPSAPAPAAAPKTSTPDVDDAVSKATSGTASTSDVLKAASKVDPAALTDAQKKAIRDRLGFIANHPKASDVQKKQARAALDRLAAPAPAKAPPAGPTPQAPGPPSNTPKAFPPHVQHARAVAGRAVGRPTGKAHVDAYGKLTKDDFDQLDSATQRTIRDDLANAKGKFLDPRKQQAAQDLLDRFGSRHTSPAPGAPAAPSGGKTAPTGRKLPAGHVQTLEKINSGARVVSIGNGHTNPGLKQMDADGLVAWNPTTKQFELTDTGRAALKANAPQAPGAPAASKGGTPTHVDDVKVGDTFTDSKGTYVITETPAQGKIKGYRMTSTAHGGQEVLATKLQIARDFGLATGPKAAARAPHPKGYSDPQQEAVKAASSGTIVTDDVLKTVGRLSPASIKGLDDTDRKQILGRLAFVATHPKATPEQKAKAAAYGRIINGGSYVPAGQKWDHTPSLSELHAEEGKGGHAKVAAALKAADVKVGLTPGTQRVDVMKDLGALSKAQFDSLTPAEQRKILDALQDLHLDRSGGNGVKLDRAAGDAITAYSGQHPGVHRLKQAEADFRAGKITGREMEAAYRTAAVQQSGSNGEVDVEAARIARDNPTLPISVRAVLVGRQKYGTSAYSAIGLAQMAHNWEPAPRFSSSDFADLFKPTDADLLAIDPIHAQAVRELQQHVLGTGLASGSPWSTATKDAAVTAYLQTKGTGIPGATDEVPADRLKAFNALPGSIQARITRVVRDRATGQNNHAATGTYITLSALEGRPLSPDVLEALKAASDRYAPATSINAYRKLTPTEFANLPAYAQRAITTNLDELQTRAQRGGPVQTWSPQDNPFRVMPASLADHLNGTRTVYTDRRDRNAADIARYGTQVINPYDRTVAYSNVSIARFAAMTPGDQDAIKRDLDKIAHDPTIPLPIRYDAQMTKDVRLDAPANPINADQMFAVINTRPNVVSTDATVAQALTALDKADFDKLDPTFREAIDERIKTLPGNQLLVFAAKFHPAAPGATPAGVTPTTVQANVPPHVQDALDTIYGVHKSGKSHTMAHQLSVYGALRGSDFNNFNPQEQTQLLGDLSFIATTAKGPSAAKAKLLIDRFTPPGTPAGQVGTPAIIPPANSVPGQVRYATPLKGLSKAKDSGKSGDGWLTLPGGQRVWGAHGAAGLLLQHVDPQTGEKRYLMVQRGPAISDPGKWTFPGGASDSKETPHQGATRETIEELGLKDDVFKDALVHGDHTFTVPGSTWKYTTVAAQVPNMIKPDLSTAHARAETSDAKWMTEAEIRALDKAGKLHGPIAGGKLEQNVISLFPQGAGVTLGQVARPGPVTKRLGRLRIPAGGRQSPANYNAWPHAHKPSKGKDLIPDKTTFDAQRQKIKQDRKLYDGKTADGRLAAIGAQQGFDDTPTVLDKKEIDRLLATGDYIEVFRGVSGAGGSAGWRSRGNSGGKTAAQINEEMRSGPAYYGKGIFGNGYYLATQRSVATQYADGTNGSIARMLIPKTAITQKYDKVKAEAFKNPRQSKAKGASSYEESTFYDPGRYAAAKGVDGIEIEPHHMSPSGGARHVAAPGKPAFNWLNRSVLIMQKEPG